ncbi:MAG: galactitol-1-phosphate 5-dehydrogenase [Sedimentisphaerales bacterium]|nr:galactitol-1-phosphate 5-dehydrogenase [Sedimentisphaerales bacterium]
MKALVYKEPYRFECTEFPDPTVGDDDVLVRVKACGICGSDIHGATGKTGRRLPPLIMGHEAAGIVEDMGKNANGFVKGDRVCFDSTVYCNQCDACRSGRFNRCVKRQVLGVSVPEFKRHGAFAEFVAVPSWIVSKIPENLSFANASLLEPTSIGMHAANRAPISKDDTVLVMGAGTIGLFILQGCKLRGAARAIVVDINEFRLDVAKQLGADILVNPLKSDLKGTVLKETQGQGVNVALEAVGYAKTFADAVSVTKTGGSIVAVGNLEPKAEFDLQQLVAREHTFIGSYASSGEFRDCIQLVASGQINVEPLISDILPLEEGPRAFERLLKAEENLLKIVLEP